MGVATVKGLPRSEWERYFDDLAKRFFRDLNPEVATVELVAHELGDQVVADRARVVGFTYDPRDNVLEVALQGLDHLVYRPREITVAEGDDGFPEWVEVLRDDGDREVIHLRRVGIQAGG